jgi:hypothetical protein
MSQAEFVKQAEQKLQYLEAHQKNFMGKFIIHVLLQLQYLLDFVELQLAYKHHL